MSIAYCDEHRRSHPARENRARTRSDPGDDRGRCDRGPRPAGALDRGRSRDAGGGFAAQRPRSHRPGRADQARRRHPRCRHARHRRDHGLAAADREEARSGRDHVLDAHPPQRGGEPARPLARGDRLYSQARIEPRALRLGLVSPRAHREDPRARGTPQAAARAAVGESRGAAAPERPARGRRRLAPRGQPRYGAGSPSPSSCDRSPRCRRASC